MPIVEIESAYSKNRIAFNTDDVLFLREDEHVENDLRIKGCVIELHTRTLDTRNIYTPKSFDYVKNLIWPTETKKK